MHIICHRLIYNCTFEHLRLEIKSGISCKIKQISRFRFRKLCIVPDCFFIWVARGLSISMITVFTFVYHVV